MLKEQIRASVIAATKARNDSVKNILKVILGEIDTQEARQTKPLADDDIHKIIRKTVQGLEEMLQYKPGDSKLETEKRTLEELLPKMLDSAGILLVLKDKIEELKNAKSDGQATGIAMKFLKEQKHSIDGNEVAQVVKGIRNG